MDDATLLWLLGTLLVAVIGWWVGRRTARHERPPLPRDYLRGLDHLLHGRLDAAVEALDTAAAADDDVAELQFALGALFRKRGEFDRATGLHEQLARHELAVVRDRAEYELALDFAAAGLMDRAEQRLLRLAAAGPYRGVAQLQLLRLYEIQSDWLSALRLHQDLPDAVRRERASIAAHYLCELADQAVLTGERTRAATLLDEAERYHRVSPRIALLRARLAEKAGSRDAAPRPPALEGALLDATTRFQCADCGFDSGTWLWRCPVCYGWDKFAIRR
jgi:lipopolysaccharide assembly protein B